MSDWGEELAKDAARLKAALAADGERLAGYTQGFWPKYGAWVCSGVGLLVGFILGKL